MGAGRTPSPAVSAPATAGSGRRSAAPRTPARFMSTIWAAIDRAVRARRCWAPRPGRGCHGGRRRTPRRRSRRRPGRRRRCPAPRRGRSGRAEGRDSARSITARRGRGGGDRGEERLPPVRSTSPRSRRSPSLTAAIPAHMSPGRKSGSRLLAAMISITGGSARPAAKSFTAGSRRPSWKISVASGRDRAGHGAADVVPMGDRRRPGEELAAREDRHREHHVVEVGHPAEGGSLVTKRSPGSIASRPCSSRMRITALSRTPTNVGIPAPEEASSPARR